MMKKSRTNTHCSRGLINSTLNLKKIRRRRREAELPVFLIFEFCVNNHFNNKQKNNNKNNRRYLFVAALIYLCIL